MAFYRKKPVLVQAIRVLSSFGQIVALSEDPAWFSEALERGTVQKSRKQGVAYEIVTLEGTMEVAPGDYIIRGLHGELYPCKPDIFAQSYAPVSEPDGRREHVIGRAEAFLANIQNPVARTLVSDLLALVRADDE